MTSMADIAAALRDAEMSPFSNSANSSINRSFTDPTSAVSANSPLSPPGFNFRHSLTSTTDFYRQQPGSASSTYSTNTDRRSSATELSPWSPSFGERPRSSGISPVAEGAVHALSIPSTASLYPAREAGGITPTPSTVSAGGYFTGGTPFTNASGGLDYNSMIRNWLSPADFQLERLQLQKIRTQRTFEWLLTSNQQFHSWMHRTDPASSVLWLCDRPGSGKSVAVSLLLQAIETHCLRANRSSPTAFAYVFGKRANRLNPTPGPPDVLKSLAFQIFRSFPVNGTSIDPPQGWTFYLRNSAHANSANTIVDFLGEVTQGRRIYIIIDGVDEMMPKVTIEHLLNLPGVADGTIRLLISTRMRPDVLHDAHYPTITLSPPAKETSPDLKIFVKDEVSKIEGFHRSSPDFDLAVRKVIEASNGLFVWAAALIRDLKASQHQGNFWETMNKVPKEIQLLVREELWRVWQLPDSKRRLSLEVLEWLIFSLEPLHIADFPFGRVLDSDDGSSFVDYENRRIDRKRFLLRFSPELLCFPNLDGRFMLFHPKIADFILSASLEDQPRFQLTDGPVRIALSCILYLSSPCFSTALTSDGYLGTGLHAQGPAQSKQYLRSRFKCLEYSSCNLLDHCLLVSDVTVPDGGSELVSSLVSFILSTNSTTWVQAAAIFKGAREFKDKFLAKFDVFSSWVEGVILINHSWRASLDAVSRRLRTLKSEVENLEQQFAAAMRRQRSHSDLGTITIPQSTPAAAARSSRSLNASPNERSGPGSSARGPVSAAPAITTSFFNPFDDGGIVSPVSPVSAAAPRRTTRRTREEIEQGLPANSLSNTNTNTLSTSRSMVNLHDPHEMNLMAGSDTASCADAQETIRQLQRQLQEAQAQAHHVQQNQGPRQAYHQHQHHRSQPSVFVVPPPSEGYYAPDSVGHSHHQIPRGGPPVGGGYRGTTYRYEETSDPPPPYSRYSS